MKIFLGYDSAIEYWRLQGRAPDVASRSLPAAGAAPKASEVKAAGIDFMGISHPWHLVVASSTDRRTSSQFATHAWGAEKAVRAYAKCNQQLYVATPETAFIQMATRLNTIELIQLGYELCGAYSLASWSEGGFQEHKPFTTVDKISRRIAALAGVDGAKKARAALRYILDGAESPMETVAAMLLHLPPSLGGYGLSGLQLNTQIVVFGEAQKVSGKTNYRADLFWPEARVAVEYDSNRHHTSGEDIAADSKKRNALRSMGITVFSLTWRQIAQPLETDRFVTALAKALHVRLRSKQSGLPAKRRLLRTTLLASAEHR